ncbi:hypothetical protein IJG04_01685 [Candidatus Saccharibacteria bacterium]|nr:hypothetical protein [Candidatus Saccharibacteria bacterium]
MNSFERTPTQAPESVNGGENGEDMEGIEIAGSGEKSEQSQKSEAERSAEELREAMDIEGCAQREDPEGLANALRNGMSIQIEIDGIEEAINECRASIGDAESRLGEITTKKENTKQTHELRREALVVRVKKLFGLGDKKLKHLEKRIRELDNEEQRTQNVRDDSIKEISGLEERMRGLDPDEPKRDFLEKFNKPMSPSEKERLLKFEALAQLSTGEYVELWRRLNPFFVTHVTRQGVRDHSGMIYHTAGMGEVHNGLKDMLSEKSLKSPALVEYGLRPGFSEGDVGAMLKKEFFEKYPDLDAIKKSKYFEFASGEVTPEYAADVLLASLPLNTTLASADPWADKQAVHFARHMVASDFYGGETDNEAFLVFPTDVIASQCRFGGHVGADLTRAQIKSETKWNDFFVWSKSGEIPIDAGIVFLPKSTSVDPETGSRYATKIVTQNGTEKRAVEKDEELINRIIEWAKNLKADAPELAEPIRTYTNSEDPPIKAKLVELGISEKLYDRELSLQNVYYNFRNLAKTGTMGGFKMPGDESLSREELIEKEIRKWLDLYNLDLKLASSTIPAEEYWENYFSAHPEARPAHMVYYDGDPTEAVEDFLGSYGVLKRTNPYEDPDHTQQMTGPGDSVERDGVWLGFEHHYIEDARKDKELQAEHDRFNEIARTMITEFYSQ